MRKTVLALLTGVLLLSAVEWDIEQVTTGDQYWNDWPVIALDYQGNTGTAYYQYGETEDSLMYASNATGSWVIEGISHLYGWYSLDYDSEGNAYIVFSNNDVDRDFPMDIYLATDTSGIFEMSILVEDTGDLDVPVIKLDDEDNIHFIYVHWGEQWNELFYGWIDEEGTHTELVTDSFGDAYSADFTFDLNNSPHVFYDGPGGLWHAYQSSLLANPDWALENIFESSGDYVSAATDSEGYFHLACNPGESLVSYLTNEGGAWQYEIVSDTTKEDLWPIYSSIALDPKGSPHIAWVVVDEGAEPMTCEIYLGSKTTGAWNREQVTSTGDQEKTPDDNHFLAIDPDGYGHIIYVDCVYGEEDDTGHVYHAKSTEPLTGSGIAERPAASNPFNLEVHGSSVHFSLPEQGSISVNLYDACGRRVQCLASGAFTAGEHAVPINSTGLAAGVYFIHAEIAERSANAKFVLTR